MSKVVVIKGQSISEMTDEEYAELTNEVQKITSEGNMVALGEDKCFFCGQSYFSDEYQMFYSAKDVQIYVARCHRLLCRFAMLGFIENVKVGGNNVVGGD
jgi:hypothetical protein